MKGGKRLRYGYTTGSCSAGAAKAATLMLLGGEAVDSVALLTPKGWTLDLTIHDIQQSENVVSCAVRKDSGDDPDVTDGMLIYARVKMGKSGIKISGGEGIGVITQKGLSTSVGSAAINDTPRKMIEKAVSEVSEQFGYSGGLEIEIYAPAGEEVASRTFNARLGIKGGISILGTSGIVEPMSEDALKESLYLEMNVLKEKGKDIVLFCPGNYGWAFAKDELKLDMDNGIKISNFVGEMYDRALELGFNKILYVAHLGKAVKVAGGIMNTHSKFADCRGEILAANAVLCGANAKTAKEILDCVTTDAMVDVLKETTLCESTMQSITQKIEDNLSRRVYDEMVVGAVVFSKQHGLLVTGKAAEGMLGEYLI